MAEPPRTPKPQHDAGTGLGHRPPSRKSRWVFVFGVILAIALVVLMVFLHLTGTLGPGTH